MCIWAYSYEFGPVRGAGNLRYLKALDYRCNLISRSENPNYLWDWELNWEEKQEQMGQKQQASSDVENEVKKRRRVGFSGIGEFHLFCTSFCVEFFNSWCCDVYEYFGRVL